MKKENDYHGALTLDGSSPDLPFITGQMSLFAKSNGFPCGFGSKGSKGSSLLWTLIEGFHSLGCFAFLSW